jgi:hypothetical protein
VQTDSALNKRFLRSILSDSPRSLVSSPGVDLTTVAKFGLAARSRQLVRDVTLFALIVLTVVLSATGMGAGAYILGYVAAVGVLWFEQFVTSYRVLAPQLRRDVFDPGHAPEPTSTAERQRLSEVTARDHGNVTVFGAYTPFIGRGARFAGFHFGLALTAEPGHAPVPFSIHEVHDHVSAAVSAMGMHGVTVEDELFVSGLDLLDQLDPGTAAQLLPNLLEAPNSQVDAATVRRLWDEPRGRARPYVAIRVTGWSGEVVVTILLRLVLNATRDVLYVETDYLLLPPVRERYRDVDRLSSRPTLRQEARMARAAMKLAPVTTVLAMSNIIDVAASPLRDFFEHRRDVRAIQQDRNFNYGADFSVREAATDHLYYRYFQSSDQKLYTEVAERTIVRALVNFLEARHYEVSELVNRQMLINNGVMVGSHAFVGAPIAGGAGARAQNFLKNLPGMGGGRAKGAQP